MNPTLTAIQNFSDAMLASISGAMSLFFLAIPKVLGFLLILIVGWVIASAIASATILLLRRINFDSMARESGFSNFVRSSGTDVDASSAIAFTLKWFVRLIALVVAFDALGLSAVSEAFRQMLLWIPNLVVGIVVLVIGGMAANALANMVRGTAAQAGVGNPDLLAGIAKVSTWAFAIAVAINQIGVAQTLVNALFIAVVGAIALALGLAFGLGGRDTASKIVSGWYERFQRPLAKIQESRESVQSPRQLRTRNSDDTKLPSSQH